MYCAVTVNPALLYKIKSKSPRINPCLDSSQSMFFSPDMYTMATERFTRMAYTLANPRNPGEREMLVGFCPLRSLNSPKNTNRWRTPSHELVSSPFSQDSGSITWDCRIYFDECFVDIFYNREIIFDHKKTFSNLVVYTAYATLYTTLPQTFI